MRVCVCVICLYVYMSVCKGNICIIYVCSSGGKVGQGEARLFYDLTPTHTHVALVGVGPPPDKCKPEEETQTDKNNLFQENVRRAVAVGTKMLKDAKVKHISVDDFNHPTGYY